MWHIVCSMFTWQFYSAFTFSCSLSFVPTSCEIQNVFYFLLWKNVLIHLLALILFHLFFTHCHSFIELQPLLLCNMLRISRYWAEEDAWIWRFGSCFQKAILLSINKWQEYYFRGIVVFHFALSADTSSRCSLSSFYFLESCSLI